MLWFGNDKCRQLHSESRSPARLAGHGQITAHEPAKLTADRQAEPRAAKLPRGGISGLLVRLKEALHPLSRRYHREFWALTDVSFEVPRGQTVGILGRNGSGKSTLLQIVAGIMQPSGGKVTVNGRISALLELGAGFNPEFTGRENVVFQAQVVGLPRADIERKVPEIEAFAAIGEFFDQPVKTYSSGMFVRVAFAAATSVEPDILIVDEALAVGDARFQEKCFRKLADLRESGASILLVSHSVTTMLQLCDRCAVLEKGRLSFVGETKAGVNAYHELIYGGSREDIPAVAADAPAPDVTPAQAGSSALEALPAARAALDWLRIDTTLVERFDTRRSYNSNCHRIGNRQAQLLDYIVVSDADVDAIHVGRDAQVEIYLCVRYHHDIPAPIVGMALANREGSNIFGTNTRLMSLDIAPGKAGHLAIYRFRFRNRMAGGHYFLNLGVASDAADGEMCFLDNIRSIAHLIFEETPAITGYVDLHGAFLEEDVVKIPDR